MELLNPARGLKVIRSACSQGLAARGDKEYLRAEQA